MDNNLLINELKNINFTNNSNNVTNSSDIKSISKKVKNNEDVLKLLKTELNQSTKEVINKKYKNIVFLKKSDEKCDAIKLNLINNLDKIKKYMNKQFKEELGDLEMVEKKTSIINIDIIKIKKMCETIEQRLDNCQYEVGIENK